MAGASRSPHRASLKNSPFTPEQVPWVILKYGELRHVMAVKRAFATKFFNKHPKSVPNYMAFKRLINRFESSGGHTRGQLPPGRPQVPQEDVDSVKEFFKDNKKSHLREASRTLGISVKKIWLILRKILKWKAYKPAISTILTPQQMKVRLDCARWFLTKDKEFFAKKIIWGDEKYFVLHQAPNRQNDKFWMPANPYDVEQCKKQGQPKAMCWTGLYNGKVIGPFWIEGSMDQMVYRELLEDHVWPEVRHVATRQELWWMQDGATCHTTNFNMEYLREKFQDRIISNKAEVRWPPCSPDCNPLDYFFWGHAMNHIYRCKPKDMEELKVMVEDFSQSMDEEMIRKVCGSARERFQMLEKVQGGHFENQKRKLRKELEVEE